MLSLSISDIYPWLCIIAHTNAKAYYKSNYKSDTMLYIVNGLTMILYVQVIPWAAIIMDRPSLLMMLTMTSTEQTVHRRTTVPGGTATVTFPIWTDATMKAAAAALTERALIGITGKDMSTPLRKRRWNSVQQIDNPVSFDPQKI